MLQQVLKVGMASVLLLGACTSSALAADDPLTDDQVVIKTEDGHRLLLPKDWPIERKAGVISPVPFEQYLSMKFDQVREGFNQTDAHFHTIEQRLQTLEQEHKTLLMRTRLLEEEQARGATKLKEGR
jgi:hypothetical protein